MEDWPAWHYDSKGLFSVKFAYKLAVQIRDNKLNKDASSSSSGSLEQGNFKWHRIWQLKLPNKVKMFVWRLTHNSLPVRRNLARRGIQLDALCPLYCRLDEDCGHLFFKCKRIKECWRALESEHVRVMLEGCKSGKETISLILDMEPKAQEKTLIFMWKWWSARNKTNEGQRMPTTSEICSFVLYHLMEWEKLQNGSLPVKSKHQLKWKPPPTGFYKLNFDASFHLNSGTGGCAMVVTNAKREVLEVGVGRLQQLSSPLHAETLAAMRCLQCAIHWGMSYVLLETDSTILSEAMSSPN
jgi:hypothetical protein